MKRKIGEIYNKPIVEGDINLKTPNEIHKSELSGGGESNEVKYYYYLLEQDYDLEPVTRTVIDIINTSIAPIESMLIQLNGKDINSTIGIVKTNVIPKALGNETIIGFSIKDEKTFRQFVTPMGYQYEITEGDLYKRTYDLGGELFGDDVTSKYIESINIIGQKGLVSKEEYESKISLEY